MHHARLGIALAAITIVIPPILRAATPPALTASNAEPVFAEAKRLCSADHGQLWGVSLCGPMLLVDPATRRIITNRQSAQDDLLGINGLFEGRLPSNVSVANTALDWDGTRWSMLLWPLPADRTTRAVVLMHESWHRIQDRLGLPDASPTVAYLDKPDARIRMRLEWRALAAALRAGDPSSRNGAIVDALTFRTWRRQLGADAANEEDALERNEGLAEYTGRKLGAGKQALSYMLIDLAEAEHGDSFVRSFAYHTGPAYGFLLDAIEPHWRTRLNAHSSLSALLAQAIGWSPPADVAAVARQEGARYGASRIVAEERARGQRLRQKLARWKRGLVDRPVLVLPFVAMHIQFNPNTLMALPPYETVYPTLRVSDRWGVLDVQHGALVDSNWSHVQVAIGTDFSATHPAGPGWTLELAPGWTLVPGKRKGDWILHGPATDGSITQPR